MQPFNELEDCHPDLLLKSGQAQPVVDMITGEAAQIVFGFGSGVKTALAGEFEIVAVGKIDAAFPAPVAS